MNQPDPDNLNEPFGDSEQLPPAEAQPVGVEAIRGAWLAAITLANNICVQESDRENVPCLWHADLVGNQISEERMRVILTAALAAQQGGNPKPRETDDVQ